jgi:type III restriction enzyme
LEQAARVVSYVKNERLDFEIPYEWDGRTMMYRPDFLARVRLDDDREIMLILEMKGMEREQDRAKYAAAEKWVRAVNNHGGFGTWAFMVCKEPNRLGQMLASLATPAAA